MSSLMNPDSDQKIQSEASIDREVREKHPIIKFSSRYKIKASNQELESWATQMCTSTFSVAFNYYLTGRLNQNNLKIFCSEGILKNLFHATQSCFDDKGQPLLKAKDIAYIDKFLQTKVIPYLQKKYPLTEETVINRALEAKLQNIDNLQNLENDFLHNGQLHFPYKTTYYNEQIMRVINLALKQLNQSPKNSIQKKSHYEQFHDDMARLFELPHDMAWAQQRLKNLGIHYATSMTKQQYEQRVKSYTNYQIGRKISENVEAFTEKDIKNGNIEIRHQAVLRVLTKWAQQLIEVFQNRVYIFQKMQTINDCKTNNINILTAYMKEKLSEYLIKQWEIIKNDRDQLFSNLYGHLAFLFDHNLKPDSILYIEKYEKAMGKQSVQVVKMLHTYIIILLNRLIHGLNRVTRKLHQTFKRQGYEQWKIPLNLVVFNIGDLMRCKCSSQEKEILLIFNELKEMSRNKPQKLKIIRIKNRLRNATNDILINVKYNNLIVGQIQLAVKAKKSEFINCTNNFSHFLYELQRTIFGPISQLCSIWANKDTRASQYQAIIKSEQSKTLSVEQINSKEDFCSPKCKHVYLSYYMPARCNICEVIRYHNRYLVETRRCDICGIIKCCRCRMATLDKEIIKKIVLGDSYYLFHDRMKQSEAISRAGFFTKIQSSFVQPVFFFRVQGNGQSHLIAKQQDGIPKRLVSFKNQKQQQEFKFHNYILSYPDAEQWLKLRQESQKIGQLFLTKDYIEKSRVSQKLTLVLINKSISNEEFFLNYFDNEDLRLYCKTIKRLQIAQNQIKDSSFIAKYFPSLTHLSIDKNPIDNIQPIFRLTNLVTLNARELQGQINIPETILLLQNLEILNISSNPKFKIFPKQICKLSKMKRLVLKYNGFETIPDEIENLKTLFFLSLKGNKCLTNFSSKICNLTNLEILNLQNCSLTNVPKQITNLLNLKQLYLNKNRIHQLPVEETVYLGMQKLQVLYVNQNLLTLIPKALGALPNLIQLDASQNQLKKIDFAANQTLKKLNLSNNQLSNIQQLKINNSLQELLISQNQLTKFYKYDKKDLTLKKLDLSHNQFIQIGNEIFQLKKLNHLNMSGNKITVIPDQVITQMVNLKQLKLSNNQIKNIPLSFSQRYFTELNLSNNLIEQLKSQSLFRQRYTGTFDLSVNKIKSVPHEYYSQIENLKVDYNYIQSLDISAVQHSPSITISLSHNQISKIPEHIKTFKALTMLDLSYNHITEIQQWMEKLNSKILTVKLNGNMLKKISCCNYNELILHHDAVQPMCRKGL